MYLELVVHLIYTNTLRDGSTPLGSIHRPDPFHNLKWANVSWDKFPFHSKPNDSLPRCHYKYPVHSSFMAGWKLKKRGGGANFLLQKRRKNTKSLRNTNLETPNREDNQ